MKSGFDRFKFTHTLDKLNLSHKDAMQWTLAISFSWNFVQFCVFSFTVSLISKYVTIKVNFEVSKYFYVQFCICDILKDTTTPQWHKIWASVRKDRLSENTLFSAQDLGDCVNDQLPYMIYDDGETAFQVATRGVNVNKRNVMTHSYN